MNREYLYANWRGGNALLGRVAGHGEGGYDAGQSDKSMATRVSVRNFFFIPEFKFFVH